MPESLFKIDLGLRDAELARAHHWLAQAACGVIIADGRVAESEKPFLTAILSAAEGREDLLAEIEGALRHRAPPKLRPFPMRQETAEKVMRYFIEICVSDHELHASELKYLLEVALNLGLDERKIRTSIYGAAIRAKLESFQEIKLKLTDPNSRHWLAGMVLRLIMADGRVDRNEITYLSHVHELLEDRPDLLEGLKVKAKAKTISTLPPVGVETGLARATLRYLLGVVMSDFDADETELDLIREAARGLGADPGEADAMIRNAQAALRA